MASLADGDLHVVELQSDDRRRAAELVTRYADLSLGAADASVVAVAERLGLAEVATMDRRHFSVIRPRHVDASTLLPHPPWLWLGASATTVDPVPPTR